MYAACGIALMFAARRFPLAVVRKHLRWVLLAGLVALLLVLVPGIGRVVGGARRWIPLGLFSVQPAEFAKVMTVLFMANAIARRSEGTTEKSLWLAAGWAQCFVVPRASRTRFWHGRHSGIERAHAFVSRRGAFERPRLCCGQPWYHWRSFFVRSQPYRHWPACVRFSIPSPSAAALAIN